MIQIEFFSYFFVLLCILGLWMFSKRAVFGFAILALIISWISDIIDIVGFTMISSYAFLVMSYYKHTHFKPIKLLLFFTLFVFSVLLMKSHIPGIYNWHIIDNEFISNNAVSYSLFLNIDRGAVAIALGIFALRPIRHVSQLKELLKATWPIGLFAVIILAALGISTSAIDLDFKIPDLWLIWMIVNLSTVCISQELFLRVFVQENLCALLPKNAVSTCFSIILCALIFGLLFPHHPKIYVLTFIAGLFYGYVYHKTGKVESSIMLHFTVNVIHFFFFTYPYLNTIYF